METFLKSPSIFRNVYRPVITILILLVIANVLLYQTEVKFYKNIFDNEIANTISVVNRRFQSALISAEATKALFLSSDQVTKSGFELYSSTIVESSKKGAMTMPLIIEWVNTQDKIQYVYPTDEVNQKVVGLDINKYSNRLAPLLKAKDTRESVVSEPLMLVEGYPGLLIYSPVYKGNNYMGTVLVVMRLANLVAVVPGSEPIYEKNIYIQTNNFIIPFDDDMVFSNNGERVVDPEGDLKPDPIYQEYVAYSKNVLSHDMSFIDKTWQLKYSPIYISEVYKRIAIYSALSLLFWLSIWYFLLALYKRRKQLEEDVSKERKFNEALAKSEENFKELFLADSDALMTLEPPEWKFTSANPATLKMFKTDNERDFLSYEPWKLSPEVQPNGRLSTEMAKAMIERAMKYGSNSFTWMHRRIDGEDFIAEVLLSKIEKEGRAFLLASVRDISERSKYEKELKKLSDRYLSVTNSASDVIITSDDKGNIIDWNKAASSIFGYSEEEVKGKPLSIIIPTKYKEAHREGMDRAREGGEKHVIGKTVELEGLRKDGSTFPLELSLSEWVADDGHYYTGIIRDITERKKTEETNERLSSIVKDTGDAIYSEDMDGIILSWNEGCERVYGYSIKETIGKNIKDIIIPKDKLLEFDDILLKIKNGEKSVHLETKRMHRDSKILDISLTTSPVHDFNKNVIAASVIAHDISKEKELEKAKDEFIYLASHQLKNPISAIMWNLEALLDGDEGKITKKQKEVLEDINKSTKNMSELVSGFLDVTKVESGGFNVEKGEVDLLEISDSVIKELQGQIISKKIKIVKKYGNDVPHLNIGTKTARIIFQNLLTNAVKYSPPKGTIEVAIEKTDKGITISVKDNGYGIPNNAKSRIFSKLFRADNVLEKEPTGTGLGLYLIKQLVEKLGGKVWFESEEELGSTFYVNLK